MFMLSPWSKFWIAMVEKLVGLSSSWDVIAESVALSRDIERLFRKEGRQREHRYVYSHRR